jgi:4-amino-4-deoxy-L-arabinose transferase-like glycosyltransferase
MMEDGDYITPVFNNELRTDKPPLHYYFMMISYSLWGKTPFAARFFSGFIGSIFLLAYFLFLVRHTSDNRIAWWSIFVLWSGIHFVLEFHLAVPDPYLIACVGISLMAFYHWIQTGKRLALWGMYVFLGFGVLAKGPVAVILPGLSMLLFLLISRQFSFPVLRKLISPTGILLFLTIVVPWYYMVWKTTDGAWIEGFLLEHNISRFTDTKEGHGGFFLITIGYYLMGFLPFVFFISPAFKVVWHDKRDSLITFASIITLVFIIFFSFSSTQLPNYAMPAYPFTALLVGHFLNKEAGNIRSLKFRWHFLSVFLFAVLLFTGVFIAIEKDPNIEGMYHLLYFLLPLLTGTLLSVVLGFKGKNRAAFLTLGTTFCVEAMFLMGGFMPQLDKRNPVYLSAQIIENADSIAWHQSVNPAFVFRYGIIPELQTNAEIKSFLSGTGNVLLTTDKGIKQFDGQVPYIILFEGTDLFDNRETRIISGKQ